MLINGRPVIQLKQVGIVAMVALGIIFWYLVFMAGQFRGLMDPNACDYAQIGRNIAQGEGFTTDFVRPLSLARVPNISEHPDLTYPPLHPALIALLMRGVGDDPASMDRRVALATGIPYLLCVVVVFMLGYYLFNRQVAWLAVALFATNLVVLRSAVSGLEVCLLSLFVSSLLLVVYLLARDERHRVPLAVVAGLLLGLVYLTKYIWIVALVPVLLYIWFSVDARQRTRIMGVFLATFIVVIMPWCVRMYRVSGNPFFTLRWQEMKMGTRTNPGNTLYRSYLQPREVPGYAAYCIAHPREIFDKIRNGIATLYAVPAQDVGVFLAAFFIVGIMVPLGRRPFERLRYLIYALFVCMIIALAFVVPASRLLDPLIPIVTVISCGFFFRVLQQRLEPLAPREYRRYMGVAIGLLGIAHVFPTLLVMTLPRNTPDAGPERQVIALCQQVGELVDGPVVTDVPWLIAWYGKREAIWLPKTIEDLHNMEGTFGKFKWLLLTPMVARAQASERTGEWINAWRLGTRIDITFEGFRVYRRVGSPQGGGSQWILFKRVPGLPESGRPPAQADSGA